MLAARMPVSHRYMSFDFRLKRALRGLGHPPKLWLPVWMAPLDTAEIADLFSEPADLEDVFSEAIEAWDGCAQSDPVDRTLQFFTTLYLQDDILVKVDRATMMHGLEARAPFLDIDLVDLVRRIPSAWKFRNGQTKYILKKALETVLPADVLHRRKKGFGVPDRRMVQGREARPRHGSPAGSAQPGLHPGEAGRPQCGPVRPARLPVEPVAPAGMAARLRA